MTTEGIFSGLRVVELAQYVFVPGAGVLLADQGAEVIKVETPGIGDPYRTLVVGDGREIDAINLAMEQNNRNKKSIALDLKSPEGREALLKLIDTADVFLTSLRPKALRGLNLEPDDLLARNPKLIYARGNGLGYKGAEADKPGFDASAFWARGGLSYAFTLPGNAPTPPRGAFGDHAGATSLAFGIAGALFKRERTGKGCVVETSLLQTAMWMLSADITFAQVPGYTIHGRGVSKFPLMNTYATRDGRLIMLMLLDPRPHWPALCRILGLDELIDDTRYAENSARMENSDSLIARIAEKIADRDWSEWKPVFDAWDAPWELIRTVHDLHNDPQAIANDMMFHMDIDNKKVLLIGGPTTFDRDAMPIELNPSPSLGAHTQAILSEIGYSADAIEALKARAIVQ